tara:strand:- start:1039 stop:2034 length:996 start_codon:yes stop_codon:yes gene_type:complete
MKENLKSNTQATGCVNMDVDTLASDLTNSRELVKCQETRKVSYTQVMPRILDLLVELDIRATFFIIGLDADLPESRAVMKRMVREGHELANHTMHHLKQFAHLPKQKQKSEIVECQKRLEDISGKKVVGFRAPGYTINETVLLNLSELEYKYDTSLNISLVYILIKHFFKTFLLRGEDKSYLSIQSISSLLATTQPYFPDCQRLWKHCPRKRLLEIPINVIPVLEYPFVSHVLLSFGYPLSRALYSFIQSKYRFLNFELHDYEFAKEEDYEKIAEDSRNKGFYLSNHYSDIPYKKRRSYFVRLFKLFKADYQLVTMEEMADRIIDPSPNAP